MRGTGITKGTATTTATVTAIAEYPGRRPDDDGRALELGAIERRTQTSKRR